MIRSHRVFNRTDTLLSYTAPFSSQDNSRKKLRFGLDYTSRKRDTATAEPMAPSTTATPITRRLVKRRLPSVTTKPWKMGRTRSRESPSMKGLMRHVMNPTTEQESILDGKRCAIH